MLITSCHKDIDGPETSAKRGAALAIFGCDMLYFMIKILYHTLEILQE